MKDRKVVAFACFLKKTFQCWRMLGILPAAVLENGGGKVWAAGN